MQPISQVAAGRGLGSNECHEGEVAPHVSHSVSTAHGHAALHLFASQEFAHNGCCKERFRPRNRDDGGRARKSRTPVTLARALASALPPPSPSSRWLARLPTL